MTRSLYWASLIAQLVKYPPAMQETLVLFLGQEDLLEKGQATHYSICGLPCVSAGKESGCNAGDLRQIPGLGRSPGEGKGYPLQYSGLENSMDSRVNRVAKSQTQLSVNAVLCKSLYLLISFANLIHSSICLILATHQSVTCIYESVSALFFLCCQFVFMFHIQVKLYRICLCLTFFTLLNTFSIHLCCCKWKDFILSHD